ncbi:MAG TPA: primosomal protein N' [Candidatus Ornithomonoglobus intestinigallinarum]|uniref:Replication restart protein PriA n=1 Tax=Candidatus Ornithomonoglobus intestinigallinarum TaxID=2840894 RepID=A0A9D1H2N3_9FIRM|nr:primosomal protein N' [Candidatus Ornithomonoglobus intestinigallinarum]
MIAKVIVDHRSKAVDRPFDYAVPKELEGKLTIGSRVLVPFSAGNTEVEGFCVGFSEYSEAKRLKKILRAANELTAFDEDMLKVIEFMHEKYLAPYLDIIHAVLPGGTNLKSEEWIVLGEVSPQRSAIREKIIAVLFDNGGAMEAGMLYSMFETDIKQRVRDMIKNNVLRREYRVSKSVGDRIIRGVRLKITPEEAMETAARIEKKAPVQARMLEILSVNDFLSAADLSKFAEGSASAVTALCKKGCAELFDIVIERRAFKKAKASETPPEPTDEQAAAVYEISGAVKKGERKTFLLHGVTGSGKTEVFMRSIANALEKGKSALVLVPEISLTPQMVSRFLARFGERIAVFHSRLSQGERYDQWKRIKNGEADIVIGARSAVFAPLKNIGIIIMDEEHSDTYKSEMSPRYKAKDIALFRAEQYGSAVVLASATPSVESYYRAVKGDYRLLELKNRVNSSRLPDIYIADMRGELARGNRSMFSAALINELRKNLERHEQTILLMNRRGFSTFVSCRSCGYTVECPNCSISLTYHKYENRLKCHYCGYTHENYTICPECGSRYIRYFGGGTQRVEEEVHRLFPQASVVRMDIDTTSGKNGHEKILRRFAEEKTDVLIGTQMVAKGLDFENVTLVGVVSADTMLHINDYRSAERTFDILEQVCGRAGRGSKKGRAVIQTYSPENEAITLVKSHDYKTFFKGELAERRALRYPPFSKIIAVLFSSGDKESVKETAKLFLTAMGDIKLLRPAVQVLGPIPSALSKIKNKYRWQLLIKCADDDALNDILRNAEETCRRAFEGVAIVIDKDPNMLY